MTRLCSPILDSATEGSTKRYAILPILGFLNFFVSPSVGRRLRLLSIAPRSWSQTWSLLPGDTDSPSNPILAAP